MKDLGKVTFKFKLGGGLNALCVAGASAIAVHSFIKIGDWMLHNDVRKLTKQLNGALHELGDKFGVTGDSDFEED